MSGRLTLTASVDALAIERNEGRSVLSGIGIMFALWGFWMVVPDAFVPAAWAAVAFILLEAGNALAVDAYRLQGHATAGLAALSAFFLTLPDGHEHRIFGVALLIAVQIAFRIQVERHDRAVPYGSIRDPGRGADLPGSLGRHVDHLMGRRGAGAAGGWIRFPCDRYLRLEGLSLSSWSVS